MSNRTIKRIWPVSLVMSLGIIGVLAVVIALTNSPGVVMAHENADHETACAAMTEEQRRDHNAQAFLDGEDVCPAPGTPGITPTPTAPAAAGGKSVSGGQNVEVPPGRPTNLTAEAYADGIPQEEIQLTWDSPTDGGSTRQYRIDISENDGTTWYALESDVRNTRYLHADLLANETFTYRVFATNQHGISAVSNDDSGTTANSWVPARPGRLTAKVGTEGTTPI